MQARIPNRLLQTASIRACWLRMHVRAPKSDETNEKEHSHRQTGKRVCCYGHRWLDSEMDREIRSVLTSVCIITALCIPVTAILVVRALICALKITFSAANKLCACVQSELELLNELCAQNQKPVWDELDLFAAFIKGDDVHGGRERNNNLRYKLDNKKKTAAKTNDNGATVLTSKVKRPMIGNSFFRSLLDSSPVCTFLTAKDRPLSRHHKNQECVKSDAVKSTSGDLENGNVKMRTEELRAVNSSKDCKTKNTTAALCTDHKLHHQDTITRADRDCHAGKNGHCSHVSVPSENNATRKAKRASSSQVTLASEVTPQENQRSHSAVKKDKKRRKAVNEGCNKVAPRQHDRSSLGAKKGKKRRKAVQASECSAKKRCKDPIRREISSSFSLRKLIAQRLSEKARAKARQRKLMELILTADKHILGQIELTKVYQNTASRNEIPPTWQSYTTIPSEGTRHESGGLRNVFEELMNGKRPLPVNPFKVEPAQEPMDTSQELLPTAPSMTELVSLVAELHISQFTDSVCDISDQSESDCDSEYDPYPELQSLPQQVLNLIEFLA